MLSVSVPEQSELTEYVPERARLGKRMPLSDPFSLVICVKLPPPSKVRVPTPINCSMVPGM
jgi:hypothetical protein